MPLIKKKINHIDHQKIKYYEKNRFRKKPYN